MFSSLLSKINTFLRHAFGGVETPDQRAKLLAQITAAVGVLKAGIGVAQAHNVIPAPTLAVVARVESDIDAALAKLSAVSPAADFRTLAGVLNTAVALLPAPYGADAAAAVAVVNAILAAL